MNPENTIVSEEHQVWLAEDAYQICICLSEGLTMKEAAHKLHKSEQMIRNILQVARMGTGCSTYQLVALSAVHKSKQN